MTLAESLTTYLKGLRDERGLTQAQAAAKIGVARVDWNRWERGKRGLGELNAERISNAFDRPLEEVLAFVTPRGNAAEVLETLAGLAARVSRLEELIDARENGADRPQTGAGGG